ncbi:MAG: hypothetical protein RI967_390, partial [Planctomycetota bacterium]
MRRDLPSPSEAETAAGGASAGGGTGWRGVPSVLRHVDGRRRHARARSSPRAGGRGIDCGRVLASPRGEPTTVAGGGLAGLGEEGGRCVRASRVPHGQNSSDMSVKDLCGPIEAIPSPRRGASPRPTRAFSLTEGADDVRARRRLLSRRPAFDRPTTGNGRLERRSPSITTRSRPHAESWSTRLRGTVHPDPDREPDRRPAPKFTHEPSQHAAAHAPPPKRRHRARPAPRGDRGAPSGGAPTKPASRERLARLARLRSAVPSRGLGASFRQLRPYEPVQPEILLTLSAGS